MCNIRGSIKPGIDSESFGGLLQKCSSFFHATVQQEMGTIIDRQDQA